MLLILVSCDNGSKPLNANFSKSATELIVKYSDNINIVKGTVTINDRYTYEVTNMVSGVHESLPLSAFVDSDGNYFNPNRTKVLNVFLFCEDSEGQIYYASGEF